MTSCTTLSDLIVALDDAAGGSFAIVSYGSSEGSQIYTTATVTLYKQSCYDTSRSGHWVATGYTQYRDYSANQYKDMNVKSWKVRDSITINLYGDNVSSNIMDMSDMVRRSFLAVLFSPIQT